MESDDICWGLREIAKAIRCTERQTEHLRKSGVLPVRKVGGRVVASRKALIAAIIGAEPAQ